MAPPRTAPPDTPFPQPPANPQVAVANQPASALASFDVPTSDAKVSFSGPFVGPCAGVDATGKGTTAPCAAGPVTVTTQYYKVRLGGGRLVGVVDLGWLCMAIDQGRLLGAASAGASQRVFVGCSWVPACDSSCMRLQHVQASARPGTINRKR